MLLTITTRRPPARDLGYLLAKNPDRVQSFPLAFGAAHVFYPAASDDVCTVALLLDIDPVGLVRGRAKDAFSLGRYVSDRPYVASSFLSVAIAQVLGTALSGRSRERPELAASVMPLEARLSSLPSRGGEALIRTLFEPLGYRVEVTRHPLDPAFPEWGESAYFDVVLEGETRLCELLAHLYVLVPVLDEEKHYWVGEDEIDKLLAKGAGWLSSHPARETIAHRYLRRQRSLTRLALDRLVRDDDIAPEDAEQRDVVAAASEERVESKIGLDAQRREAVTREVMRAGARRVLDLGCGSGKLIARLLEEREIERVVGIDVSMRALEAAAARFKQRHDQGRVELLFGSVLYRDARMRGFDAIALVEVIEHVDPDRLPSLERVVFELAKAPVVIVTTPNVEHNVRFEGLAPGAMRHGDHRFEWTRDELRAWATHVGTRFGYEFVVEGIGVSDAEVGAPTQMVVFSRAR